MRLPGFLQIGGTELANDQRTLAYLACQDWEIQECDCEAYDSGPYVSPSADPAPWFVSSDARSGEFFGFLLDDVRLLSPFSRTLTERLTTGSTLGRLRHRERTLQVSGLMVAETGRGMSFGERWLHEMLRVLCVLEEPGDVCLAAYCETGGLRMMRSAGVMDGPNFSSISPRIADFETQRVGFQIVSELPYLYQDAEVLRDASSLASSGSFSNLISTEEWPDDRALEIVLEAGSTDATSLKIRGRVSLDGTCPETRVAPCLAIDVPTLPANGRLSIDATRQEVRFRNPISLETESGFSLLSWERGFEWPEVPPCTDLCLTVSNDGAQAVTYTLRSYKREL